MILGILLAGAVIFGPQGEVYHQYDNPGGSQTIYTPHGVYQTFRNPGGSETTYGPDGVYQSFPSSPPRVGRPFRGFVEPDEIEDDDE